MDKRIDRLFEVRMSKKYSCETMARKLKICKTHYWLLENGKRGLYYRQAYEIAKVFGTTPDQLFLEHFETLKNGN